jgi:hypothetical protein
MNRLLALLLFIALFVAGCSVITVVMRPTVDSVAHTAVNHMTAPDPLADVLEVRAQSQNGSSKWWAFIALLFICGLVFAGILVGMGRFPKAANAWRRMRKPPRSQLQRPYQPQHLLQQPVSELPQLPRTLPVQQVQQTEDGYWSD